MKKKFYYPVLYFLLYAISGLNYKLFSLFLTNNSLVNIALYSGVTSLLLVSPVFGWAERLLITQSSQKSTTITIGAIRNAFTNYGWGLSLSIICTVGWSSITYAFLVNYGTLLALLITTFSRLITPFLSAMVFGDHIGSKKWYWFGLIISLFGMVLYEVGENDGSFVTAGSTVLYIILSAVNLLCLALSSVIKRYITSDPKTDSLPVRKTFLAIRYKPNYNLKVSERGAIVEFSVFIILLFAGLITYYYNGVKYPLLTMDTLKGVLWIGIIGGLAFNLSLKITNLLSNVVTVVIDGIRPLASLFLFPVIVMIFQGAPYSVNLNSLIIGGFIISWINAIGIVICCLGAIISLRLGRPAAVKNGDGKSAASTDFIPIDKEKIAGITQGSITAY